MESIRKALGAPTDQLLRLLLRHLPRSGVRHAVPEPVPPVVFDGNVDPRRVWYDANLDQDIAFDRNIKVYFDWVAKYDSVYHLGDTAAQVEQALLRRAEEARPAIPADGMIGPDEWNDIFLRPAYYVYGWEDVGERVRRLGQRRRRRAAAFDVYPPARRSTTTGTRSTSACQCTDAKWPTTGTRGGGTTGSIYAKAPFLTWNNAWFNAPCASWAGKAGKPVKVNGTQGPARPADQTRPSTRPRRTRAPRGPQAVPELGPHRRCRRHHARGLAVRRGVHRRHDRGVPADGTLPAGAGQPFRREVRPGAAADPTDPELRTPGRSILDQLRQQVMRSIR